MPTVNVTIKTVTGVNVVIADVDTASTVTTLKGRIEAQLSIPIAEQRIVFNGKVMINENTLSEAGLVADGQVFLVRSKPAEVPPPAPAVTPSSVPATPAHTSLFGIFEVIHHQGFSKNNNAAPQPASASRGPGAPGRAPGPSGPRNAMSAQLGQLMQSPQGQAMMQQVMSNPDLLRQIMASNPQLSSNPEAMAMLSDPGFLAGMSDPDTIQSMLGGGFDGGADDDNEPLVSLELFNIAMDCLNGAEVPDGFPHPQADNEDDESGSSSSVSAPPREFISMDALDRALDVALGLTTPTHTPMPVASAAPVPSAGSSSGSAPPQQSPQPQQPPAASLSSGQYAQQLETLSAMGFSNRSACLQALNASNGDVSMALAFLTDGF